MTSSSERAGWRGMRLPPLPGRTSRARLRIGGLLVAVGILLVFVALVPLSFMHRVTDRVDVTGTVTLGVSLDTSRESMELDDGENGYWKVDYEIDGTPHTGLLRGSFSKGQTVVVSVPGDGSIYRILSLADPGWIKILSWLSAIAAIAALIVGSMCLVTGMRQVAQRAQRRANAQVAASTGIPLDVLEARQAESTRRRRTSSPAQSSPHWQQTRTHTPPPDPAASEFFHRPYDL